MGFISWWKEEPPPPEQGLFDSFLDMPFILKMITVFAVMPLFSLVVEINPDSKIVIGDELVTYSYLWKSGRIWHSMYGTITLLSVSYFLLRRNKHSRSLCLLAWGTYWFWAGILDGTSLTELFWSLLLSTCFFWLYLYKRKPVVEYFRKSA